jgi:MFS family permease
MATKAEINTVYAAGLVQGIALVTFPAASTIFTSPSQYGLSNTQYGFLFLPQVVTAITTSVLGGSLAARFGTKRVFLAGLVADLASMALLIISVFFTSSQPVAYGLLLAVTACLGTGFGLTVPVINTLTAAFHPGRADASVLVLNALLGLGTTLAPVFVAIFVGLGFWWGLPVLSSVLLLALIAVSAGLPLRAGTPGAAPGRRTARIPVLFWVFAAFAVLYGFCETMNGNWSQLDMTSGLHASATQASLALTAFWGMATVGRVLFARTGRWFPPQRTYHTLPFLLAIMFVVIALLPTGTRHWASWLSRWRGWAAPRC